MDKPRVVHILYSGLGGHSAVLFALLEAGFMRSADHHILFVGVEAPPMDYIRRCSNLQISWTYVSKVSGKQNLAFQISLAQKLVKIKPDVLFLHGSAAIPAVFLLKIVRLSLQIFVLLRDTQANHLKTRREWIFLAIAYQIVDRVVQLTDVAVKGTQKRLGVMVRQKKVCIIPNGLDTAFYSPANEVKNSDEAIHIGMLSRLQPNKDHPTLIEAFVQICQRHPDKRFHLHIAGDGSTYATIQAMIQRYNLSEVATLYGTLGQLDLRDFLRGLDIYVHCTHGETMSTALMQALSCGLPTVASDVPGVSNMVTAEAGILYKPGDSSDLAEKLSWLVDNPEERQQWGGKARKYALANFSVLATVKAYEAILPPTLSIHTQPQ